MTAQRDRRHLERLLALEELAVEVYGLAVAADRLRPRARALATELHGQEQHHVAALVQALGSPSRTRHRSVAALERALAREGIRVRFGRLRDEAAWLGLLQALERAMEGAYYLTMKRLRTAPAAVLAATIMANEAQHAVVLSELRRPGQPDLAVPSALVEGSAAPQE